MEIRKRSPKTVARRHDLDYFKKGSPVRHWQWRLALAAIAASVLWVAVVSLVRGPELLSRGPISSSHAAFGSQCEACHQPLERDRSGAPWSSVGFRRHVSDQACQSCHQVPGHQPETLLAAYAIPDCATCHIEHTGSMMLANAPDKGCTRCHANLKSAHVAPAIRSFLDGHPQFAPLRAGYEDGQNIKFNHQAHLQKGLNGSAGPVEMNCADCHRTAGARTLKPWRFAATPQMFATPRDSVAAPTAVASSASTLEQNGAPASPLHPTDNRAYMAPSTYAESCSACHTLKFDRHIAEEAPHASPETVRNFIREKIQTYAAQNPQTVSYEIVHWSDDPSGRVPQYRPAPPPRNAQEWVDIRSRQAERRLWYQSCNLCHLMKIPDNPVSLSAASVRLTQQFGGVAMPTMALAELPQASRNLPTVAPTQQKSRWFTNAVFSHQSHIAVGCEACHARTRNSNQGTDILLPGIAACEKCHDGKSSPQGPALSSGHAESGCFLCHGYHDWANPSDQQASPVTPHSLSFKTIGELRPR